LAKLANLLGGHIGFRWDPYELLVQPLDGIGRTGRRFPGALLCLRSAP
jgi:hypothetical protein